MANIYRGFSTIGRDRKYRVTDFELVKQDLINHLHIRKGEKLMNPEFGTIIWNILHEPFTEELKQLIVDDIKAVASYDPRLYIENIKITSYSQGIQIELGLVYVLTDQRDTMNLMFDNRSNTVIQA